MHDNCFKGKLMKKNILKTLLIFLILPVMVFSGCKKSSLPAINLSTYLKDEITIKRFEYAESSTEKIGFLTKSKADTTYFGKYLKFTINAEPVWFYKMYVEYISFYVYCSEASDYQMTINVSISDVASEDDILNSSEEIETDTFTAECTIKPKQRKAIKCKFPINKAVVNALGSTITIDVMNSLELFSDDEEGNASSFKWLIYGLEIHGESRAYSIPSV